MAKYCCFIHPTESYEEKELTDVCPECEKTYGFPLNEYPDNIKEYKVLEAKGRGFYAATFLCETGNFKNNKKLYILKVSPKIVYEFFGKDFSEECEKHLEVANGTSHIVGIENYFDQELRFGGKDMDCHVAVLNYVDGESLEHLFGSEELLSPRAYAQITIDLLTIWDQFIKKEVYHNDLHAGNIMVQKMESSVTRTDALEGSLKLVAIDLGSVGDGSKSGVKRFGDQHQIADHVQMLIKKLKSSDLIKKYGDADYRIVETLELIAYYLIQPSLYARIPSVEELITTIKNLFYTSASYKSWSRPMGLPKIDDGYNAQSLNSYYIPSLLVDPEDKWVNEITNSGPILITGMRGCGKTMLLRALDFHSRAHDGNIAIKKDIIIERLKGDTYLGISTSCQFLVSEPHSTKIKNPLEKLFLAFCISALNAIRHLKELCDDETKDIIYSGFENNIAYALKKSFGIDLSDKHTLSDINLEIFIDDLKIKIHSQSDTYKFAVSPIQAFINLAISIKKCASIWIDKRIFFLLDDVSTRYLSVDIISEIMSILIFQNSECAFKMTTEAQTLNFAIMSPGYIEKANIGRDYQVFDLGKSVNELIKKKKKIKGKIFIEWVLEKRQEQLINKPHFTPREVLGDCTLIDIARKIIKTSGAERTGIYHGLTALSALCVGDIGDVIVLFNSILNKMKPNKLPVSPQDQSSCYHKLCSSRLFTLDVDKMNLKKFADAFSQASYKLLLEARKTKKIRQYTNLHVTITSGDVERQKNILREIIDAGVFVLTATREPREKTKDKTFVQYKLTYRKLFGISNFIGLSETDRFELTGEMLEKWLYDPSKETLLKNLTTTDSDIEVDNSIDPAEPFFNESNKFSDSVQEQQLSLFALNNRAYEDRDNGEGLFKPEYIFDRLSFTEQSIAQLSKLEVDTLVIGLGFEERTLESVRRSLEYVQPNRIVAIRYAEIGKSDEIYKCIKLLSPETEVIEIEHRDMDGLNKSLAGVKNNVLVDITGLSKPYLFNSIRCVLDKLDQVHFCVSGAQEYYPLPSDIDALFQSLQSSDVFERRAATVENLITGEKGPYSIRALLPINNDSIRPKVLCAFSSPKNQRMFTMLEQMEYSQIELVIPPANTSRDSVSREAAQMLSLVYPNTMISQVETNNLGDSIRYLLEKYYEHYVRNGFNTEMALTGSKIQAVACAAVSTICRISQCWYVEPSSFDISRFTKGIGETKFYLLKTKKKE